MPPTKTTRQNGWAIRGIREGRGWSVTDLAKRLDIRPQTLSNIEREVKKVSTTLLTRIARELDIPSEALDRDAPPMCAVAEAGETEDSGEELDGEEAL